jgi:hypothetical protein
MNLKDMAEQLRRKPQKPSPLDLDQLILKAKRWRPVSSDLYRWESFLLWCHQSGIELKWHEDHDAWWELWKGAYIAGLGGRK